MKNNTVKNLGELELRELVDLGLRMPDGSTELFEVVNISDDCVTAMTKNIIDFMPFNKKENKHSGNVNYYAESSIRSYLAELYQSVTKENKLLETHTFGHRKEFFLPTASALGSEAGKGWVAFRDNASRVKYLGEYATIKDEAYGLGEADWYWTSTTIATCVHYVCSVSHDGSLDYSYAYNDNIGVTPVLNLKSTAPVILIDGVWYLWYLYSNSSETLGDKSPKIKIGDWIEVTHTTEKDIQAGILLGDCFEVVGFGEEQELIIKPSSTKTWYLFPDQARKIKPPLTHHKKTQEPSEHDERLKGYYQYTAIETLRVYHTAHKVKEGRIKALNKVLENIQELIKLEKHD